jgi:hypothetical protein
VLLDVLASLSLIPLEPAEAHRRECYRNLTAAAR